MTDIVRRLRKRSPYHNDEDMALHVEAANEIKWLRTALRAIAGARPRCCKISDAMQGIARAALAEADRR